MDFQIPFHEMEFSFARSRGPGGQNVNRTNSAVILRWNLFNSTAFDELKKQRLEAKLAARLTAAGDLIVRCEVHRDQIQNRSDCIKKLYEILQRALFVPKKRVATKPTKSSQKKRLESKKKESATKILRRKVHGDE